MRILVTGGNGMIGRNLQDLYKHQHSTGDLIVFPSSLDYDLTEYYYTVEMFEKFCPDIVIHLAAKVAGLNGNINNNFEMLTQNTLINTNVMQCCKQFKVKRVINVLSTCVFPDKIQYPIKSEYILDGPPNESNEGYATSKRLLYTASKLLVKESPETTVINLVPTNLYGKYDNYDPERSHVIPALIHKVLNHPNPFVIQGSGMAKRQFVYAEDFARIIKSFVEMPLETRFHTLIVSPPESKEITIKQLATCISKAAEYTGETMFTTEYEGQHKKTTDDTELRRYLPNFVFTDLDTGLKETIEHL